MSATVFAAAFAALYASHMVGDHLVQTDRQAAGKAADRGWLRPMAGHLLGYGLCQALALVALRVVDVEVPLWPATAGVAFSVVTHGLIDRRWPVRWLMKHTGPAAFARLAGGGLNGAYLADQSLHVGCLFIAALVIGGLS
ncbi:DUF3307 domain-containing protein [Dactylosporangium roseum]|uniref:DUF3307 domain-containing protein n=1 Tax=Dactylosporangium roseum TaxID=47989 RepID=A0ABY5Z8P7_9ACTN|nr:DUF3307 domain-containing protein [Dactylosporangium roseum]UWZ37921.1 DUF3307 domain-containing protein [Dactylosporangium roseum]